MGMQGQSTSGVGDPWIAYGVTFAYGGDTTAAPRAECPWIDLGPTDGNNLLGCFDGSFCNGSDEGWSCCNERGGRARCPRNLPNMCFVPNECGGGTDYCCEGDCMADNGVTNRPCPAEPPYISGGAGGAGSVEPAMTAGAASPAGWTT